MAELRAKQDSARNMKEKIEISNVLHNYEYLTKNYIVLQYDQYLTMDIVTLSSKGQIVIPSKVRKKFSLKEGDSLVIIEESDGICLKPLVNLSELWGVDSLKGTGTLLKEMRKEWDDELDRKPAL